MRRLHNFCQNTARRLFLASFSLLIVCSALNAQSKSQNKGSNSVSIQSSLDDYLSRVRSLASEPFTTGSLWFASSRMNDLAGDYKARHPGDLLIIRVVDNFSATNTGTAQQQRTFNATAGVSSSLIANAGTANKLTNLFSPTSTQNLNGKGQSALTSTLSLNLSARVVDTLANGVLVVEAVRDFTVGNDRQTIVLHGLVRPGDIAVDNSVPSSSIANLEAQVRGKGVVADSIRQPNLIARAFLKILGF
jgi:flagellar L-ring protein precursor FlgH